MTNRGKAIWRVAIIVTCVLLSVALGFRFGAHFFVWLRIDRSLKAVPRVDVESLANSGQDDVQFRAHTMDNCVVYVPVDAEEVKSEEDDDEDCLVEYDKDEDETDLRYKVLAPVRFSIPSLKATLIIVVNELVGGDVVGPSLGATAQCLATSSADFRWSDTPSQVMEFAARYMMRESKDVMQYYFERANGAEVLITMDSPGQFTMTVDRPPRYVYDIAMALEEESEDDVYKCFGFLRRMASFYVNPAAQ